MRCFLVKVSLDLNCVREWGVVLLLEMVRSLVPGLLCAR